MDRESLLKDHQVPILSKKIRADGIEVKAKGYLDQATFFSAKKSLSNKNLLSIKLERGNLYFNNRNVYPLKIKFPLNQNSLLSIFTGRNIVRSEFFHKTSDNERTSTFIETGEVCPVGFCYSSNSITMSASCSPTDVSILLGYARSGVRISFFGDSLGSLSLGLVSQSSDKPFGVYYCIGERDGVVIYGKIKNIMDTKLSARYLLVKGSADLLLSYKLQNFKFKTFTNLSRIACSVGVLFHKLSVTMKYDSKFGVELLWKL